MTNRNTGMMGQAAYHLLHDALDTILPYYLDTPLVDE